MSTKKQAPFFKIFIRLIFITVCSSIDTAGYAQKVTLNEVNAPLNSVLEEIKNQTGYSPVYTSELLKKANTVSIKLDTVTLSDALKQIFAKQPLGYTVYNKLIILQEGKNRPRGTAINTGQTWFLSGTVNDAKGQPVPGATVFLTNTQNAAATNLNGKFILNGLTPGNYILVINMMGFEPYSQNISIQDRDITINAGLKENNTLLKAVSITATKPQIKKRYMDWFTRNFIGNDDNARQCKILNPEVLNFTQLTGQNELVTTADSFLVIKNDALGYRIKYLLKKCVYYINYDVCYYDGSSYFEELKGTAEQQKKWEENRRKTYLGSRLHFLRAVINNQSRAEGFFTYTIDYAGTFKGRSHLKPVDVDTLFKTAGNNSKRLISKPSMTHDGPDLYVYYALAPGNETALTWLAQCDDNITIDKNGSITPDGNDSSIPLPISGSLTISRKIQISEKRGVYLRV